MHPTHKEQWEQFMELMDRHWNKKKNTKKHNFIDYLKKIHSRKRR